jgi:hypothetical protein
MPAVTLGAGPKKSFAATPMIDVLPTGLPNMYT